MTAPATAGGSTMPWRWRLVLAALVTLAVAVAPGPTGDFAASFLHGLGAIGCRISETSCVTDMSPDQLNPLVQVNTHTTTTEDYSPRATVLRRP
jgi:hypothetical protein